MIGDLIKGLAQQQSETRILMGTVVAIDAKKRICDVAPHNGDATLFDVRLQGVENLDSGFFLLPKKGSEVVVILFDDYLGAVVQTTEIEKMEVKIDKKIMEVSAKGISIKSDKSDLRTEIDNLINGFGSLLKQLQQPTFVAGQIPVLLSPTALPKIIQIQTDLIKVKTNLKTILE